MNLCIPLKRLMVLSRPVETCGGISLQPKNEGDLRSLVGRLAEKKKKKSTKVSLLV